MAELRFGLRNRTVVLLLSHHPDTCPSVTAHKRRGLLCNKVNLPAEQQGNAHISSEAGLDLCEYGQSYAIIENGAQMTSEKLGTIKWHYFSKKIEVKLSAW